MLGGDSDDFFKESHKANVAVGPSSSPFDQIDSMLAQGTK